MDYWKGKNVIVTGGAGFIGSHLSEELLVRGVHVKIIDNLERGNYKNLQNFFPHNKVITVDLTGFNSVSTVIKEIKETEVMFDLASKLGGIRFLSNYPASIMASNLKITSSSLELARKLDVEKYIFASSSCVYGKETPVPHSEKDAGYYPPESFYGWSKILGEALATAYYKEYGIKTYIVRLFNVYGPRENFQRSPHVIPNFIKSIFEGKPLAIYGRGDQTRSFVYVKDVITGMLSVAESNYYVEPFNLGTDIEISMSSLAKLVIRLCGKSKWPIIHYSPIPGDVQRRSADLSKAKRMIGWQPKVDLDTGIRQTIEWYKDE